MKKILIMLHERMREGETYLLVGSRTSVSLNDHRYFLVNALAASLFLPWRHSSMDNKYPGKDPSNVSFAMNLVAKTPVWMVRVRVR